MVLCLVCLSSLLREWPKSSEEHVHILTGQARGWTNIGFPDSVMEAVRVGRQVLAHADELGMTNIMTNIERAEQERTIQGYLLALRRMGVDLE